MRSEKLPHRDRRIGLDVSDLKNESGKEGILKNLKSLREIDCSTDKYWEKMGTVLRLLYPIINTALIQNDFQELIELGRKILVVFDIPDAEKISSSTPTGAIAVTEACNLAAKTLEADLFYALKPALIVSSWKLGADFGRGMDGAYYLSDPIIGTASFHDPGGEVESIIRNKLREEIPTWHHGWSRITRQDEAFKIISSLGNGGILVDTYAESTLPESTKLLKQKWMRKEISDDERTRFRDLLQPALSK